MLVGMLLTSGILCSVLLKDYSSKRYVEDGAELSGTLRCQCDTRQGSIFHFGKVLCKVHGRDGCMQDRKSESKHGRGEQTSHRSSSKIAKPNKHGAEGKFCTSCTT